MTPPAGNDREHEALRRRIINTLPVEYRDGDWRVDVDAVADFILAERAKREGPIVEALDKIRLYRYHHTFVGQIDCGSSDVAAAALAAYRALDAAPVRTLEQVAADVAAVRDVESPKRVWSVPASLLDELAAALEARKGGE